MFSFPKLMLLVILLAIGNRKGLTQNAAVNTISAGTVGNLNNGLSQTADAVPAARPQNRQPGIFIVSLASAPTNAEVSNFAARDTDEPSQQSFEQLPK